MTLHQLKVFVKVAKLNSFAQAAKALHISQPSVSGVVQDLQEELGIKLFERLGNKRQLSEAGKRLYERAQHSIAIIEGIKDELDELKGLKKGKLSVGSSGIGTTAILAAVHEFKTKYPDIEIRLALENSGVLYQRLLGGDLDAAILGHVPSSPHILTEPYSKEEIVLIAPPRHPLARKRSVPLKLLAREPLIVFKGGSFTQTLKERFAELGVSFRPLMEVDLELNSREALKSAVESGLGIGYLTKRHIMGDVRAGLIKILNVPELKLMRTAYLAVHKTRYDSPLVRAFVDLLKQHGESITS